MDYINKDDLVKFNHLQVPRLIWNMYINKELNNLAFQIYVEFFDRVKLSAYNNWIDGEGRVYIKYSYEELMKILKVGSRGTISKGIKCLKEKNLVLQEKGFNTSSKFYLSNVLENSKNNSSTQKETQKYTNTNNSSTQKETQKYTNTNNSSTQKETQKYTNTNNSSTQKETQKYTFLDASNNNYNHNNINNKEEESKEKISSSDYEIIIKEALDLKVSKTTMNNIKKYTKEELQKTVKYMILTNKPKYIRVLLAILRDKDYLNEKSVSVDTKVSKEHKVNYMKELLDTEELEDWFLDKVNNYCDQGFMSDTAGQEANRDLERYLCKKYNKLEKEGKI